MNTRLIRVGNSQGIVLPKKLLPVVKPRRQGWDERFQQALAQGPAPEGELLAGLADDLEDTEWQW